MYDRELVFTAITISEIVLIILAVSILPRMRKSLVSMILVLGLITIFITHIIYDKRILGGNVSFIGASGGSTVHLDIWDDLGFCVADIIEGREIYTFITAIFVHANILHLLMNSAVLLFLGVPFEEKIGARNFLILFFAAGIGAALLKLLYWLIFHSAFNVNAGVNGIGASGAIFGVLGAFVALYPRDKVMFPLIIIRPWPVFVIALIYGSVETLAVLGGVEDGVGHLTHINGFLVGVGAALVLKRAGLLDKKAKKDRMPPLSISRLEEMAKNEEEIKTLKKIRKADMAEIRDAWIEHFLESAECPRCGSKVDIKGTGSCGCEYVTMGKEK